MDRLRFFDLELKTTGMNYQLVPAEFICCICGQPIKPNLDRNLKLVEQPVRIIELKKNGIEVERFAHPKCADGLAGKP